MSLPWRDEIGVFLTPSRLVMVRLKRGLRRRVVHEISHPLADPPGADWRPAVSALAGLLAVPEWTGAGLRIAVADQWVRQSVVPVAPGIERESEQRVYARHWLGQTYGDLGEDWQLALGEGLPGRPFVVAALPLALVAALRELAAGAGVPLLSVTPQLAATYARWRSQLPIQGWLVSLQADYLAAARLAVHGWDRIHAVRCGTDVPAELQRLVVLDRLASGEEGTLRLFVDAPPATRAQWQHVAIEGVEWLEAGRRPRTALAAAAQAWGELA